MVSPAAKFVPEALDREPLDAAVRALFEASWGRARAWIASGKVSVDGAVVLDERARVRKGAALAVDPRAPKPRADRDLPPGAIVFVDAQVVVVDKPPGISTVPYRAAGAAGAPSHGEDEKGTLDARVRAFLEAKHKGSGRPALGVVHRIDKETSGLVVFTRTWGAKQHVSSQFRHHTTHRRYLAIVHGAVVAGTLATIRSHLVDDRGDGLRGSWERTKAGRAKKRPPPSAQVAVTHVEVVEALEGATLVACRLETGRTHQIRVHLSEAGHPIVGERVYVRGYDGPEIPAPRLMLHAAELGFVHPTTQREMRFTREMPEDMRGVLARLVP
jgi:23S rRNA pseudouridine1911/1915/1917 synthase